MQNVAIFGGTFNPVHWGHLLIAETALSQFALDRVIWVPTFCPPHKPQPLLEFGQRLALVQQAIADHPAFVVSDIDTQQPGVSYAIVTLQNLQRLYPDSHWFWITGSDAFQSLSKWRASEELAVQCTWLVAPRGVPEGKEVAQSEKARYQASDWSLPFSLLKSEPICWHLLQMPLVEISSSLIRQYCREGRSTRYLVPETVRLYMIAHKLYQ